MVLAGTTGQMTGRQVARLVRRGSQPAVNAALDRLVSQGLVTRAPAPPAYLYAVNREHLAYPAVEALASMRTELISRLRAALSAWETSPVHASLFGSAARGDGDERSDIDIFLVRPRSVAEDDEGWQRQTDELSAAVEAWTGNPVSLIEFSDDRVADMTPEALAPMLSDGVQAFGVRLSELIDQARSS